MMGRSFSVVIHFLQAVFDNFPLPISSALVTLFINDAFDHYYTRFLPTIIRYLYYLIWPLITCFNTTTHHFFSILSLQLVCFIQIVYLLS